MIQINPETLAAIERQREALAKKAMPYKTEQYGKWAADLVKQLHDKRSPIRITPRSGNINTLRLRLYHGMAWARENVPDFAALADGTICRKYHDYLELHIRAVPRSAPDDGSEPEVTVAAEWRVEFELFMDTSKKGDKIDRTDVSLLPDDMAYINAQLAPFEGVMAWDVQPHKLFICRLE